MSGTVSTYLDSSAFDSATTDITIYALPDYTYTPLYSSVTIGPFTIGGTNLYGYNDNGYLIDSISQNYVGIESSDGTLDLTGATAVSFYIGTYWIPGDAIAISVNGVPVTTVTPDGSTTPMFLGLTDTAPITSITLSDATSSGGEIDLVTSLGTNDAVCYLRGTRILTPTGEVAVEDLKIGDVVLTRFGAMRPVRWIGRQNYQARLIRNDREKIPVRIRASALGERMPARDLYVSPGHSMLVDGVLVLAKLLVNGTTITQDWTPDEVHYHQIDLGTHDCVVAEGTWSETYADAEGLREQFHNAAEFRARFPDDRPPEELTLCAPRPERGARLEAALRPVTARASAGLTPGPLRGFIDRITAPWKIGGWAQDEAYPELPVLMEVLLGDRVLGTVLACAFRGDLLEANIGQGRCGFVFRSPVNIAPGAIAGLRVRRAADGAEIPMSAGCIARISGANVVAFAPPLNRMPAIRAAG
jgi:hypothetical protein